MRAAARILARSLLLFALLVFANFVIPRALPGDPLATMTRGSEDAPVAMTAEARAALAAYYGLDRPLHEQLIRYIDELRRGDLGSSIHFQRPVADLLATRLPWSLLLGGSGLLVAAVAGGLLGVRAAWRNGRREERALTGTLVLLGSLPEFAVGLALIVVLAVWLPLLPARGALSPFASCGTLAALPACAADAAVHLALPLLTLSLSHVPGFYLVMRAATLAEVAHGYVVAGRARGLAEGRLALGHAARNALMPFLALFGARLGLVVGGVVVVETVFAYPGIGQLAFEAVLARDYPVLQAVFLIAGSAVLVANALTDLVLARIDPRQRAP